MATKLTPFHLVYSSLGVGWEVKKDQDQDNSCETPFLHSSLLSLPIAVTTGHTPFSEATTNMGKGCQSLLPPCPSFLMLFLCSYVGSPWATEIIHCAMDLLPEVPPTCLSGSAVHNSGPLGASWNCLESAVQPLASPQPHLQPIFCCCCTEMCLRHCRYKESSQDLSSF